MSRVAIVTGGGTGIGLAIARHFGRDGARLVLASRREEHLEPAVADLRAENIDAIGVPTDIREPEQVQEMVGEALRAYGRVDVLVNNAAGNFICPAERLSPNGWAAVRSIVLDGSFYCSRAVGEVMIERGEGAIVNILATYAWGAGAGTIHSACAKAGVMAMTRTLAVEWGRYGIRVNAVAPGPVDTPGAAQKLWPTAALRDALLETIPVGRLGRAGEIAAAVGFLASDEASFINGAVLPIDGGQWLSRGTRRHQRSAP